LAATIPKYHLLKEQQREQVCNVYHQFIINNCNTQNIKKYCTSK